MPDPRDIRVFVASPGDVISERERLERVVVRLNKEFARLARFSVIRWEHNFYQAHRGFQDQIVEPAECDIVVVIFGNRLGSELPDDFEHRLPDGTPYPSGTAFELISSVMAADAKNGRPAVYVFRTTAEPRFAPSERVAFLAAERERARLDAFFDHWFRTPSGGFRRAFQLYADPDDLAVQVDELLRQWAGLSLRTAPDWQIERDGSPFRGLEQFDAAQSRVFFGRDRKVERATDELVNARGRERGRPFLLVVGPSGSGKSSLVRAGLVPRLTAGSRVKEIDSWRVAVMKPGAGATAFAALAKALFVDGSKEADPGGFGPALPELGLGPYKSPPQLAEVLEAAPAASAAPVVAALDKVAEQEKLAGGFRRAVRTDLLLVVDQLEEIFAGSVSDGQRAGFARLLTAFADTGRVWIVATLRADLYIRMLDSTSPFLALKDSGGQYDLASPGQAELAEILQKSAEAAGLVYDIDTATGESLDDQLLRDASGADSLPLLQFSLKKLFEKRSVVSRPDGPVTLLTPAAYQELGGLDGAIDTVAEETIGDLVTQLGNEGIDQSLARLLRRMAVRVGRDHTPTTSQPGLTVRAVALADAIPDELSRTLVETLMRARLLVSDSGADEKPYLRLAHERVLTSWRRARTIVQAHREYFRIRADVEQEHRRWAAGAHRRELLLSAGTPLQDAEGMVRDFGDELPHALREYVALSGRRARFRQRATAAAALVFFIAAVFASGFGLLAYSAEQKAARNYAAAKGAADQLVASIARDLRQQQGIKSETLDIALGAVQKLLDNLQKAVSQQDWFVTRELQFAFARVQKVIEGSAYEPQDDAALLERSQATLLYEFAETYHRSANDLGQARVKAEQSLAIMQRLRGSGDTSPDLLDGIAKAEIEIGDVDRATVDQSRPRFQRDTPPADYSTARAHFETAARILLDLIAQDPERDDWALDSSRVLTRLGDLDLNDGKRDKAEQDYDHARTLAVRGFRRTPKDADAMHELVWSYRKLGELELKRQDLQAALGSFRSEVCMHRRILVLKPYNALYQRDLAYGLTKLADAELQEVPADQAGAEDAFLEALHIRWALVEADRSAKQSYIDFLLSLQQVGDLYKAENNAPLADAFSGAAASVRQRMQEAFHDSYPADESAKVQILQSENLLRERGALPMMGSWGTIVLNTEHDFAITRLDRLSRDAAGCWDQLEQTVALDPAINARP